jgi:tetratricopeptide (TPR) repeat protein
MRFKRATDLGLNFAYAYSALGLVLGGLGEANISIDYTKKAFALRERVCESEKVFISVEYYLGVTGEIEEAVHFAQIWSQNYPRDRTAHNRLAYAYGQLGQRESAPAELEQARRLGGDNAIDVGVLARTYMVLDRLLEARALLVAAHAKNPGRIAFRQGMYLPDFFENDMKQAQGQVDWAMHNPGTVALLVVHSDTEAYFGLIKKARELSLQAKESVLHEEFKQWAALLHAIEAVREAEFGNPRAARQQAQDALAQAPGTDVQVLAALALARARAVSEASRSIEC